MRRGWIIGLSMSLGIFQTHLVFAVVAGSAPESVERGYTRLAQARVETDSTTRERLLTAASAAFKEAYQTETAGLAIQVQALLGAAQVSLCVQSPRRVFPFLWQATPLQRAERNLQQALVLHKDNAAAALLLGIVYWRQATQTTRPQQEVLERSQHYLTQAASLGLPIRLAPTSRRQAEPAIWFGVEDTLVALRYIDARGVGKMDDLLFVYQAAASGHIFGVVVTWGQVYSLVLDTVTGALAPYGLLETMLTIPQLSMPPILVLRLQQDSRLVEARFTWDGTRFVSLPALP